MAVNIETRPSVRSGRQNYQMNPDYRFILRMCRMNALVIFMCAVIGGVCSYVILDSSARNTYSITAVLAVTAKGDSSQDSIDNAVIRSLNMFNSNTLIKTIHQENPDMEINGKLSASRVANSATTDTANPTAGTISTNLIWLRAEAFSPRDAFILLKSAICTYPSIASYFDNAFITTNLTPLNADMIETEKETPGKTAVMAACLILAAGVGLCCVYCMMTDRIYGEQQAKRLLDLVVIGNLHKIKKNRNKGILISDGTADISYMEEIDRLATELSRQMEDKKYKVLMGTSIQENEGKTTVLANVAVSLAKRGKNILLMDCDFRKPAVSVIFELEKVSEKGIQDAIQKTADIHTAIIKDKKIQGLSYLLQKKSISKADQYLESSSFRNIVDVLRNEYDYILIDTAPIGMVRDAEIIAAFSDAVILLIRSDYTRAAAINDTVDLLEDAGADVLGGILNCTERDYSKKFSVNRNGRYYGTYRSMSNSGNRRSIN